jgi:hypothetical protein
MNLAMPTTITLIFGLLVAIVVLATLGARMRLPYAILLVLGGLLLSFLPGLPDVTIDPTLILFVFLPPLIYSLAWNTGLSRIPCHTAPDLAARNWPRAGDNGGRGDCGPCICGTSLGGGVRVGRARLANGCRGCQRDRQKCRAPQTFADDTGGREYGQRRHWFSGLALCRGRGRRR